ncbi:SusD/RagB family nutrient-binding outer membrane lipoprotein [Pedobacter namyangjuensis]|uniref:SusD/RagB family nutrient-binding outer membrane lipoprotein n=1 Tax=Pedobacter namyangjuensis TaxID=600626 RepID=UPI000DE4E743|nr:SusD/RagB family nutrient-binding outer membrane lipoprotein [Pedobacter namyangjuensis]
MKNKIYKALAIILVGATTLTSCDKGFEEVNTDPINIKATTPDKLLAPALVSSLTAGMQRNRNFNNELMQVTVSISDGDATVFRYEFRRTFADYLWNSWFIQINNFKDIHALASQPEMLNESYQAISLICQSWLFSNLTDTYGDIPYSQAAQGKNQNVEPVFDKQQDIYQDIYKKLEEANTLLAKGVAIVPSSDPMFNGDVSKWRKFSNSLYLRLLLRASRKAEVANTNIAKIKQIVEGNATNYPIMQSNSESATVRWTGEMGTGPFVSPYVNGVRVQDFRAASLGSFFIDHLRDWDDPRLKTTAPYGTGGTGATNRWAINQAPTGGYKGTPSGYAIGTGQDRQSYFYSSDQLISNVALGAKSLQQSPLTGILMNYAELQFILAEAATKGWINGSAEDFYNSGIASSINYWVPPFPADGNHPDVQGYITGADIEWDNALNLDGRMELIHLQKYYALFMVDMQQWFEYRRTGHPILPKGPGLRNGGVMPARMTYPVYVQSANPTNYKVAVTNQGVDEIFTNVWWQKP